MPGSERPPADAAGVAQRGWWLEDAVPGTTLLHPGGRTIVEGEHVWLAWVTHNLSDVHGNADAASRTTWGQPLVLGMLTAAVVIGLAAPAAGPPHVGLVGWSDGWRSIRLVEPVRVGDTITARSRIEAVAATAEPGIGRVRRTISGLDQRGRVVVAIAEERTVARRP